MSQITSQQTNENRNYLSYIPFADKLSEEGKSLLAESIQLAEFPEGAVVKAVGEKPQVMPILVSGSIKVFKSSPGGKRLTLYHLKEGNTPCLLATYSILKDQNFPAEAIVYEACEVIIIPADIFKKLFEKEVAVQKYVIGLGMHRIQHLISTIEEVSFRRMDERLALFLLKQFKDSGRKEQRLTMSHLDIANELGTAREVVSRLLSNFEEENYIRLARKSIELVDYGELENFATEN